MGSKLVHTSSLVAMNYFQNYLNVHLVTVAVFFVYLLRQIKEQNLASNTVILVQFVYLLHNDSE